MLFNLKIFGIYIFNRLLFYIRLRFLSAISVSILFGAGCGVQQPAPNKTPLKIGSATKLPLNADSISSASNTANKSIMVDDFDRGTSNGIYKKRKTSLAYHLESDAVFHGTFSRRPNFSLISKSSDHRIGSEGYALKIEYDTRSDGWAGYYTLLGGIDITPYNALTLYVKGENGGESFRIGLSDASNSRELYDGFYLESVQLYLEAGITTEWQKVVVPLCMLETLGAKYLNLNNMGAILFDFANKDKGVIYVENIMFEKLQDIPNERLCNK